MHKRTVHELKVQNAALIKENKELKDLNNKLTRELKDVKKGFSRELLSQKMEHDAENYYLRTVNFQI